jgi:hypothetical protein
MAEGRIVTKVLRSRSSKTSTTTQSSSGRFEVIADLGGVLKRFSETENSLAQGKRTTTQPEDTASLFPLDLAQWRWWSRRKGELGEDFESSAIAAHLAARPLCAVYRGLGGKRPGRPP